MQNLKEKYPKFAEAIVKIFAIMGLVIIILIALYGAMAALRSIPNVWESVGNAFTSVTGIFDGEDEMELSVYPQTPTSGEIVTVSFDKRGTDNGSYSFSYDCVEGVNFEVLSPEGNSRTLAFCNTPTTFAQNGNYVRVIPTLINKDVVSVPIKIEFARNNDDEISASGETQITILKTSGGSNNGGDNQATTTLPNTSNPPTNKPPITNPPANNPGYVIVSAPRPAFFYGFADLTVKILEVGTINKFTGVFSPNSNITASDRVAVRFEVVNAGTNVSGNWRFNASLPIEPAYTYSAATQPQLFPGDKIIYTLGFDGIQNRSVNQFSVIVDPDNTVIESNELNNTAITNITLVPVPNFANTLLPLSANCTYLSNSYYSCLYNGYQYSNCYLSGNGYQCNNTTNTGTTVNLPFGTNCFATGLNNTYTCYVGSTTYTNCFVTTNGYTCYNTSTGTNISGNSTCFPSNNGLYTCYSNGLQYNNCTLTTANTYSCPTTGSNNQTGNYQLPVTASCQLSFGGTYHNCTSANGTSYGNCTLTVNGWSCSFIHAGTGQGGCWTLPNGQRYCE